MKRVKQNVDSMKKVTRKLDMDIHSQRMESPTSSPTRQVTPPPTPQTDEETSPKTNWEQFRKEAMQNYVLDQMGLSNLKTQADIESDGETDVVESIPTEEEVMTDLTTVLTAWNNEYVQSTRIQHAMKVMLENFIKDLINSSLSIMEQEDHIGTSYTSVVINSGDLTLDWAELFDEEPTRINQLTASLVYASIFIPAMVVKYFRTFSARNILKLVSAPTIAVDWTAKINGKQRHTKLTVPQGEIQYFDMKAAHIKKNTTAWWNQLFKLK